MNLRLVWSKERPSTVEALIAAIDEAGVNKAAVVHSSGAVDVMQDDAPVRIRGLVQRGLAGLRLYDGKPDEKSHNLFELAPLENIYLNDPSSTGTLGEILENAREGLQCLGPDDREWIFGKTAQQL
jgi:hypothetical protein